MQYHSLGVWVEQVHTVQGSLWDRLGNVAGLRKLARARRTALPPDSSRDQAAGGALAHARVTVVHGCVGVSWILGSDHLLTLLSSDIAQLKTLQMYKGLLYVAATTLMLYLLVESAVRRLRHSHRALLDEQRETKTLLANLPGGVYRRSHDHQAVYSFLSPGAATLLGLSVDAGKPQASFRGFVHEADRLEVERGIEAAFARQEPFELQYRLVSSDGRTRWIRDQGRCVVSPDGAQRIEGYMSDVTEQRLLEQRLQQSQRLESIGCMVSSIAHDFNNVLFAVTAGCELLSYGPLTDHEQELVLSMRSASDSGRGLVARLLEFARDQGCKTCDLELDGVVRRAQPLMKRLVPQGVTLKVALEAERGCVHGDGTQLEQVLLNLVANAAHATEGRGEVRVSTAAVELRERDARCPALRAGNYLCLVVEDTGCGIPAAVLPRIFERFFTTKGEAGTGLGLATVREIVNGMGGAIAACSEPGQGARFTAYLPAVSPAPRSLTVPPPAPRRTSATQLNPVRLGEVNGVAPAP
ncbi:MAG TPA: ATP-binding protein [Polyangiales bacterium]